MRFVFSEIYFVSYYLIFLSRMFEDLENVIYVFLTYGIHTVYILCSARTPGTIKWHIKFFIISLRILITHVKCVALYSSRSKGRSRIL